MKFQWSILGLILTASTAGLLGCPDSGILNPSGLNTLVIHNDHSKSIEELTVNKVGPVPGEAEVKALNLLASPIPAGGTFTVGNLADGRYEVRVEYRYERQLSPTDIDPNYCCQGEGASQVLEGGRTYDWYFDPDRNDKVTIVERKKNETCCILNWFK